MQINSTQRNLGFSATPDRLRAFLKSDVAKKEGIKLKHWTVPDENHTRKLYLEGVEAAVPSQKMTNMFDNILVGTGNPAETDKPARKAFENLAELCGSYIKVTKYHKL